tara:strand:+ start:2941 stop:4227 length:1287 start_codon:yes stop_codon:yes gene_type:complete
MNDMTDRLAVSGRECRVAVVGSGVSGLSACATLDPVCNVTLFDVNKHAGGHVFTQTVDTEEGQIPIDMGFIVFNERTYPTFNRLLNRLEVQTNITEMSFGFQCDVTDIQYCGTSLNGLFAQRRNIFRPRFLQLLLSVRKFNNDLRRMQEDSETTLRDILEDYPDDVRDLYVQPMGSAVWSSDPDDFLSTPATFFTRFFDQHGLLDYRNRPVWKYIRGGSSSYVNKLLDSLNLDLRLGEAVTRVTRSASQITIHTNTGNVEHFDSVILACHADDALLLLDDPSNLEQEVLESFRYTQNTAVLHNDDRQLPDNVLARGSWNYRRRSAERVGGITYNMNMLQRIKAGTQYCVSLNPQILDDRTVISEVGFRHPMFDLHAVKAARRWTEINGADNTYYCGAHWRYGFHEDGAWSGERAANSLLKARGMLADV